MNMRRSTFLLLTVGGAACLLAACSGSTGRATDNRPSATSSPAPNDTGPSDSALAATKLIEAFGPGDFMLPDPTVGLATLSSYRASLTVAFKGTDGGRALQWASNSVLLRSADPSAAQFTADNTGDIPRADPAYVTETGGTEYRPDQNETCTAEAADPDSSLVDVLEPAGELAGVMGAESLGQKMIAGADAVGYRFDERSVGQPGVGHTDGEVWIASEGGYVLAYTMTSKGGADLFGDGVDGTITWHYELTEVNQSVSVEVPDECRVGLVDAPMLKDAANIAREPGLLSYDTASSVSDVLAFYQQTSAGLGWAAGDGGATGETGGSVEFSKGDKLISIVVQTTDSGSRVNVVVGDKPSSGGGGSGGGGGGAAQGSATFELTGGHQATGTWEFAKQFSFFGGGSWTLTFQDPSDPMPAGPFLTLSLAPDKQNLSMSESGVTIIAGADVCNFAIDHQDPSGASGKVTCRGAQGGTDINITFDVTT